MTNDEIRNNVMKILNAVPKKPDLKVVDEQAILAGIELFIGFLQDIHQIANNTGIES